MSRVSIIAIIIGLLATSALAQRALMNPLRQLPLTRDDMTVARGIVDELTSEKRVGESRDWSNHSSGNSGTVTLLELFEEQGHDCRRVRHVVKLKGRADAKQVGLKACLDTDGVWKLN